MESGGGKAYPSLFAHCVAAQHRGGWVQHHPGPPGILLIDDEFLGCFHCRGWSPRSDLRLLATSSYAFWTKWLPLQVTT